MMLMQANNLKGAYGEHVRRYDVDADKHLKMRPSAKNLRLSGKGTHRLSSGGGCANVKQTEREWDKYADWKKKYNNNKSCRERRMKGWKEKHR